MVEFSALALAVGLSESGGRESPNNGGVISASRSAPVPASPLIIESPYVESLDTCVS